MTTSWIRRKNGTLEMTIFHEDSNRIAACIEITPEQLAVIQSLL